MKKLYTFLACTMFCFASANVMGQSFTMPDSVKVNANPNFNASAPVNNTSGSSIILRWSVIGYNIPGVGPDVYGLGICDNQYCYDSTILTGGMKTSMAYGTGIDGDIHVLGRLNNSVPVGTSYYVKVKASQQGGGPADTAVIVYHITKVATPVTTTNVAVANVHHVEDVNLYPNPAANEVNVVYDEAAEIKNIAIYNLIGKLTNVYKVNGNSANLNIENLPSGIYFVRLMNGQGQAVATRKFTKQ